MGVTRGFAGIKFSGSPSLHGPTAHKKNKTDINKETLTMSFEKKKGPKGILSNSNFNPNGLEEPCSWR